MTERVIETRGLRKRFGSKVAVADLSLSVGPGEVFGFLGPNGAGKTTSLKMLLGLIEPSAGTARVLGAPLGNRSARARVGFLPEHFRFHDWLTGRELLHFHGRLYGLSGRTLASRVEDLLARMDLVEARDRALRHYSKGMLQRVGLAQALLNEPRLVFLDEPTSGLDPLGRLLVRDVIRDLKSRGTSVFINSHLLGEIEATCDRVVFLKAGRTVRELELRGRVERLEVELRVHDADAETMSGLDRFGRRLAGAGDRVRLEVTDEERLPEIAAFLVGRGAKLYGMHAARPSLERVFLEVMGDEGRPG
ncbi:MAG TPA: ABC transporter ATP-binding protein [Candidatus Eisenbacteria bacterium]|nr:ABC transporter ATP-binding protein [Candidatus Eisenbacteria bacterium]